MPPFQKMNQGHKAILASGAVASYFAQGGGGGGDAQVQSADNLSKSSFICQRVWKFADEAPVSMGRVSDGTGVGRWLVNIDDGDKSNVRSEFISTLECRDYRGSPRKADKTEQQRG